MVSVNSSSHSSYVFKGKIPSVLLGVFSLCCIVFTNTNLSNPQKKAFQRELIAPPPMIERFAFGYSDVAADMLWIRALQDFDFCDSEIAPKVCRNNSWLFQMLNAITDLSPQFRIPYAAGGIALSVLLTDIDGATRIFEKGVAAFPKDWPILYRAAYHYMYEVKDNKRAAELLIQAGKNGAPPWVFTLAGRLYSDSGNLELAEAVLQDMVQTEQDPALIKRLQDKIASMKGAKK